MQLVRQRCRPVIETRENFYCVGAAGRNYTVAHKYQRYMHMYKYCLALFPVALL